MKKYNFLPETPNPPGGSDSPRERLSPQAKRLVILGGVGVVLVGAVYLYTSYFSGVTTPSPSPRSIHRPPPAASSPKPMTPRQVKPEGVKPRVAMKAPKPEKGMKGALRESRSPAKESSPARVKPLRDRGQPKRAETPRVGGKSIEPVRKGAERTQAPTGAEKPSTLARVAGPKTPKIQANPAQGKGPFTLQIASLVLQKNAVALEKRLEKLGYTPAVHMTTARISRHRVYVGKFGSRKEAEERARRLNVDGYPSNLVEGEDGKFRLDVGSSYNLNKAIDLAHTLQEKNYSPKIVSKAVPTPVHQVRVGDYGSRAEALKVLEVLKKEGFTPIIVRK